MDRIILASGSPRRKQLLEWAEVPFDILVKETAETWPPGMTVAEVPVHIARNKALAVQPLVTQAVQPSVAHSAAGRAETPQGRAETPAGRAETPAGRAETPGGRRETIAGRDRVILAADTVVVLGEEIIGKPKDRADAIGILSRLAGQRHEVITGVVLLKGEDEVSFYDRTAVWFHPLSQQEIENYVDKYSPYDKAGAYAIQEWIGVVGIKGIDGDFYNVMGLPVSRVVQALRKFS